MGKKYLKVTKLIKSRPGILLEFIPFFLKHVHVLS